MDVQRRWGLNNAYKTISSGQDFTVDAAGTQKLQISYTPAIPVWWEVNCAVGIIQKLDAAYHYAYLQLVLSQNDSEVAFQTRGAIDTQHSAVQTYQGRSLAQWWKLNTGVAYTCTANFATSGGSWQFHQLAALLWIDGRVWSQ